MKVLIISFLEQFWWLGIVSLIAFPLTLAVLPWIIVRLPSNYFMEERGGGFIGRQNPLFRGVLLILKNFLGGFILLMGLLMLFIPGQGILTILAGLSIMNFPGKRRLELKLVTYRAVVKGLNWIRKKGKRDLFILDKKLL